MNSDSLNLFEYTSGVLLATEKLGIRETKAVDSPET